MNAYIITIYIVCAFYLVLNLKYSIQMLQQNSYRIGRYWKWIKKGQDTTWKLVDLALIFILFSTLLPLQVATLIVGITCIVKCILILRKKYKKPLVFTKRVWRIYSVSTLLSLGAYIAIFVTQGSPDNYIGIYRGPAVSLGWMLMLAILSEFIVIISVVILMPVENAINRKYYNQAKKILESLPELKIIGITGSYGKTSTKHYLNRILSEKYDVLMTPGSYNTPMGVIRTVREMMKPYNEVFICEMGAKQKGDVKEICDLVNPDMGIITAVGPMHLESFKSMENVQSTKFELADALPQDGLAVVNNDFEYCANRPVNNVECMRYGVTNPVNSDFRAVDIHYTPQGTAFTIEGPDGFRLEIETRLLGECNISNLLGAVIIALRLNVEPEAIKRAIRSIDQVEHRLNVKQTAGGVTIIDDAFNSNPSGSRMACEVLSHFTDGKRIIVTPGMIELGDEEYDLNREFGINIAKNVDIAIVVGQYNRDAIVKGILSADFDEENLYIVDSFNEAQQLLAKILKSGDTVLYENDLPDTFK